MSKKILQQSTRHKETRREHINTALNKFDASRIILLDKPREQYLTDKS